MATTQTQRQALLCFSYFLWLGVLPSAIQGFGGHSTALTPSAPLTSSTTTLSMSLASDVKKRMHWRMDKAKRSASIYMNPVTSKIANVNISWEPEVARKILQLRKEHRQNHSRPLMIGVVGIPGSGKSTSSDILASFLGDSIVMPMDGYHYDMETLQRFPDAVDAIYRRGAPDTFDPVSAQRDLHRIVHGDESSVSIPGFDHAKGDPTPNQHTFVRNKHDIVICEGIYLLHDDDGWQDMKNYMDWTIFIDADIDTCINRLKIRNKKIPGYTHEEIEIRCDKVDRVNAETVERSRKFASTEVRSSASAVVQAVPN